MKPVGYSSPEYQEKLSVVNRMLGSCDLNAKERDLMIARGQQSESIYVFFTSKQHFMQILSTTHCLSVATRL